MVTKGKWIIPQCGCELYGDAIKYCPKHEAGPDMYEALNWLAPLIKFIESLPTRQLARIGTDLDFVKIQASQALAKAEKGA